MAFRLSALGQVNGSSGWSGTYGTDTALFLKLFAGEVLTTFETNTVMLPITMSRTITEGKSASFPVSGTATAAYHTPGQDILTGNELNGFVAATSGGSPTTAATAYSQNSYLSQVKHNERVINVDDELISATFISKLDEARNHYDVRAIYTTEMGRALAKQMDRNLIALGLLAARASATITGGNGGSRLDITTQTTRTNTTAADIINGIYQAAQVLDEKDVPAEDRCCVLEPWAFYKLIADKNLVNRDYSVNNGDFAKGTLIEAAGIRIVKSNNAAAVFGQNVAALTGQQNTYSGDFSGTVGLVFHKAAIGTVKLMDLKLESEYILQRRGHLFVGGYAVGHGILRPECAVELNLTAS
jgi:hypothetical protein